MINSNQYEVIIIGGGPVGITLGIELGLNQVKTLILEKHAQPLRMPRAQSLSARTMELFLRWGADTLLEDNLLLPAHLPQTGIWCSTLCGESYFETAWGDNQLKENASPKAGVRVPIWVTEHILRERLSHFSCVDFFTEHEVKNIFEEEQYLTVEVYCKKSQTTKHFQTNYLACCDGASGPSKKIFNNRYTPLSDATPMLGTLFIAKELMDIKTVPDGIMYFVLCEGALAFVGPVDLNEGLWLAQIVWPNPELSPSKEALSSLIDTIVGQPIKKEIVDFYIWDMQVQIAEFFNKDNRVFWLGDSAHAFAPTGGLGLNTGLGDSYNLAWKLAQVIQKKAPQELLETYAQERYPVWESNLNFAKNNAQEFLEIKKQYPPEQDYKAYTMAYANLGDRYLRSSGLTLGYGYLDSPLTRTIVHQAPNNNPFEYVPNAEPGYFLPHAIHEGTTIYHHLSPIHWNLVVCGQKAMEELNKALTEHSFPLSDLNIVALEHQAYPSLYLLLRPDWHIAQVADELSLIKPFY